MHIKELPWWLSGKESACNAGDMQETDVQSLGGEDPREGNSDPLQYSCLGTLMDRGASWATVQRVTKKQTQLSN